MLVFYILTPFLLGAIRFWEKRGFVFTFVGQDDEVGQMHRMHIML